MEPVVHDAAKTEVPPFPKMVVVSVTYNCASQCPACPYTNSGIRETYAGARDIEPAIVDRIARECGEHGAVIRFTGGGEPALHPQFLPMAVRATRMGARVSVITNGCEWLADDMDRFMAAGVYGLEFSVDAGTVEEYRRVRPGLSWDCLRETVRMATTVRSFYASSTRIIASIVDQVGVDVVRALAFWKDMVDEVQVRKYLTWGLQETKAGDPRPYLPPEDHVPCPWLWERLNVDTRGDVTFCGEDIAFAHKFANVKKRTIGDIWNGPEFTRIRELHARRRGHELEMCGNCPDWKYRSWQHNYWRLMADHA